MYEDSLKMSLDGAYQYESTELTLPIHTLLSDGDVCRVIEIVNKVGVRL